MNSKVSKYLFVVFFISHILISCDSIKKKYEYILLDRKMWVVDSIKSSSSLVFSSEKEYVNKIGINENIISFHKTGIVNLPVTGNNLYHNAKWDLVYTSDTLRLIIQESKIKEMNQVYIIDINKENGLYHLLLQSTECSIYARAPYVN